MPNVYEPLVLEIEPPYIGSAFSPTVDIDETADDITVTITDSRGEHSYTVEKTDQAIADAEAAAQAAIDAAESLADGVMPGLTAGMADAVFGTDETVDTFAQRVSDHDGACRIESLRGRTVVWNQLSTTPDDSNHSVTGRYYVDIRIANNAVKASHKYLLKLYTSSTVEPFALVAGIGNSRFAAECGNVGNLTSGYHSLMFTIPAEQAGEYANVFMRPNRYNAATDFIYSYANVMLFDLTAMFGAGNEPATVEEFERMYPESYYPYDAGSLLSVNVEGIESAGVTREIPAATYFPDGMRSAGSVYDELTSDKAITRIGSRAYQSGDEGNTSVITDGTTTHYALSTPVVVDIDPPLNLAYPTEQGGTESIVIPTGEMSAAPTMAMVYAYNADGVRDLSQAIIANIEGSTASTNYSVGGYFVYAGKLYKATSAIATGETINPGTNCVQTTVMAELVALTA